jgi:hypothetical protein
VSVVFFRKTQDAIVPKLLEEGNLSEAELIELVRPIAAEALDISSKTWPGAPNSSPTDGPAFRRAFRRPTRRFLWWRYVRNRRKP